jgi:hypothetical protein
MPIHLIAAYVVFVGGIGGLFLSVWLRQRRIDQEIADTLTRPEGRVKREDGCNNGG